MVNVAAWLPEMRLLLNTVESPDITADPAEHVEYLLESHHQYAPMSNGM